MNRLPPFRLPGVPAQVRGRDATFLLLAGVPMAFTAILILSGAIEGLGFPPEASALIVLSLGPGLGLSGAWYLLGWLRRRRLSLVLGCGGLALLLPIVSLAVAGLQWRSLVVLGVVGAGFVAWRLRLKLR